MSLLSSQLSIQLVLQSKWEWVRGTGLSIIRPAAPTWFSLSWWQLASLLLHAGAVCYSTLQICLVVWMVWGRSACSSHDTRTLTHHWVQCQRRRHWWTRHASATCFECIKKTEIPDMNTHLQFKDKMRPFQNLALCKSEAFCGIYTITKIL